MSEQTTSYCSYVWEAVKEVLCFDAPEGHESGEADDRDLDIGAKDTLSFSWRALKESRYTSKFSTLAFWFELTLLKLLNERNDIRLIP